MSDKYTDQRLAILEELIAESLDAMGRALDIVMLVQPGSAEHHARMRHNIRTIKANAAVIRKIARDGVP